MCAIPVVRVTN